MAKQKPRKRKPPLTSAQKEELRKIGDQRGYTAVAVRKRGAVGKERREAHKLAAKDSWFYVARYFHINLREERFTTEHAEKANYTARKGQNVPPSAPNFNRLYFGRKLNSPELGGGQGRALPLVKSGNSLRASRQTKISSSTKTGRLSYPGLRKFNLRNPSSRVNMNQEFRRFTGDEITEIAGEFDEAYDDLYNANEG